MTRKQIEAAIEVNKDNSDIFVKQIELLEEDETLDAEERIIILSIAGVSAAMCACRVQELKAMLEVTE
jgi:hypothetical protein